MINAVQADRRRGRPRLSDPRRKKLGFKASAEEEQRLAVLARLNGQTVTEFIREAVAEAAADCEDRPVFRISGSPKIHAAAS